MGIFSHSNSKDVERFLLVDIGSSSVTAAYIESENGKFKILANEATPIEIIHNLSYERFEKEMLKSLHSSLHKVLHLHLPQIKRINVNLSSPWYASQIRAAKMTRTNPFVISKTVLDDIVNREIKAFEEEVMKSVHGTPNQLRPIESRVISTALNGYAEGQPIGLTAKELELIMFIAVAPDRTLKIVEETIERFYVKPVSFNSFLSLSYFVTRDFFPHEENFMLLDIGGEVTDVSFVKSHILINSFSFPQGRNFIIRKLAIGLKRSIVEAETMLILHLEGKTDGVVKEQCEKILTETKNAWQLSFQKALSQSVKDIVIPETIMLTVNDKFASWFVGVIESEQFHQNSLANKKFRIIHLNSALFHESMSFGDGVVRDSSVMIEAFGMRYILNKIV